MMLDSMGRETGFGDQLMAVARDPALRQSVYERLGEYCHQCRNRLNSLKLSLYLARRGATGSVAESWELLESHYLELERLVERIQIICRPMTPSFVTIGLDLLVADRRAEWARLMAERGGDLVCVAPAERAVASLDVDRLGAALDALASWRAGASSPGTTARLRWRVEDGRAHLGWEEDRPRAKFTLASGCGPAGDEGWVLPLLARVLAAHNGDFSVDQIDGWRLELSWPAGSR